MKRNEFPSSHENVSRLVYSPKYRPYTRDHGFSTAERKAMRDYLAGAQSSNTHSIETNMLLTNIRFKLGLKQPVKMTPYLSPQEFQHKKQRLIDLARLLFMAEMSNTENAALRDEAFGILNTLDIQQRDEAYTAATKEHMRLQAEFDTAIGTPGSAAMYKGTGRPAIVIDGPNPNITALTKAERRAEAILIDCTATGYSPAESIAACHVFRGGDQEPEVREALQRMLE